MLHPFRNNWDQTISSVDLINSQPNLLFIIMLVPLPITQKISLRKIKIP